MYGEGISRVGEVLDAAVNLNVVKKSGAWFSYNGERLGQGRDNVKNLLRTDEKLCAEIEKQVREGLAATVAEAPEKADKKSVDPAASSYNVYKNFEEKGRHYKALIKQYGE